MSNNKELNNVTIYDNGAAYCICIDGLIVAAFNCLGDAWRHIVWMYRVASQDFTIGKNKEHVTAWIANMQKYGYIDK